MNPQLCNVCDRFAAEHQGGTDLEAPLLFADVRGSTRLAEAARAAAGLAPKEMTPRRLSLKVPANRWMCGDRGEGRA
jgi:hypothetical protein